MEPIQVRQKFGISFGCLADPIEKQLIDAGYKFSPASVNEFERIKDAIHTLQFGGIITDSIVDKAFKKLFTKIQSHVCKKNNLKVIK